MSDRVGMDLRRGVWTSQTRAGDCRRIVKLAKQIREIGDPAVIALAKRIERLALDLERDL